MTITNGLITAAEYATYAGVGVPDGPRLQQWEEAIEVASQRVEQHCGRQFHTTASSARYFDAVGSIVWITDAQSVSAVATDTGDDSGYATTVSASEYQLLPPGGWDPLIGSSSYTALLSDSRAVWPYRNYRRGSVRVTGVWGWAVIPDPVKRAVGVLAQDLLRDPESNFGGLTVAQDGVVLGSRTPARVISLLERYVRPEMTVGIA